MIHNPPIENTIIPQTPTELLLLERIHEINREFYINHPARFTGFSDDSVPLSVALPPPEVLHLATYVEVEDDAKRASFRVMARSHGPSRFGFSTYLDKDVLHSLAPNREADLLYHTMQKTMSDLARVLKAGRNAA